MGTSTAALSVGGYDNSTIVENTESWNGSSWTEVNDLNSDRSDSTGAGTYTAGLVIGGVTPYTAKVESWDGTNWTETGDLNTARAYLGKDGCGTQTAALAVAGYESPPDRNVAIVESWDGSSWTEVGDLNTARRQGSATGEQSLAIAFGGYTTTESANTETWNGTSWTETNNMATARRFSSGTGSIVGALAGGGRIGTSAYANTEEWTADATLSTLDFD